MTHTQDTESAIVEIRMEEVNEEMKDQENFTYRGAVWIRPILHNQYSELHDRGLTLPTLRALDVYTPTSEF